MDRQGRPPSPSVCGRCGATEQLFTPHRRGRCPGCYDRWVRSRPIGAGAWCAACGDRRRAELRHFELPAAWVVLCGSCAVRADRLEPQAHTVAALRLRLRRERRWGDRRAEAVGRARVDLGAHERRAEERRLVDKAVLDATEYAEMMFELEAEFADAVENEQDSPSDGPITGVHRLADLK